MRSTREPSTTTTNSRCERRVRPWMRQGLVAGVVLAGAVFVAFPAWAETKRRPARSAQGAATAADSREAQGVAQEPSTAKPAADAGKDCAASMARKIQSHYDGVRDLTARFTQVSEVVSLGAEAAAAPPATSSGEVSFARPGKMRWSYEQPEPSLVVTDGEDLWIYDPAGNEAQRMHAGEGFLSGAALQFLLGRGAIDRDFRVSALACGPEQTRLALAPRKSAAYEKLEIRVDPASGEIVQTAVFDLVGNVTRVTFESVRTNTGLADELFRFSPPDGVRVVEVPAAEK